jgi:hypothetical protein
MRWRRGELARELVLSLSGVVVSCVLEDLDVRDGDMML